jgi:hypothetical protein
MMFGDIHEALCAEEIAKEVGDEGMYDSSKRPNEMCCCSD